MTEAMAFPQFEILERQCEYCGRSISGRPEKRFCGKRCGTAYGKEEAKLEELGYRFRDALIENAEAQQCLDMLSRHRAQVQCHRYASLIIEILDRRATVSPLVNGVVLLEFNNAVTKYLKGWTTERDREISSLVGEFILPDVGENFD
jgi:hypothetical protein